MASIKLNNTEELAEFLNLPHEKINKWYTSNSEYGRAYTHNNGLFWYFALRGEELRFLFSSTRKIDIELSK